MSEELDDGISSTEKVYLTSKIVSAYVGHNPVQSAELPALIRTVYETLVSLDAQEKPEPPVKPAVSIKKSVADDYITCLEDGKKFKSLKRHLRSKYNMSPEEYREKWNLPFDYPMVAPSYARQRSKLAKEMGLGQSKAERE
ncbi:MAG: MucR family transcriptional regulator [Pseudomonadota bacterium]